MRLLILFLFAFPWSLAHHATYIVPPGAACLEKAPVRLLSPSPTGEIRKHEAFASRYLPPRDVFVYLPPGYDAASDHRYPVLYLHDGESLFEASEGDADWQVDETAQRLIEAGLIEPLIIVAITSPDRYYEYAPSRIVTRFEFERQGKVEGQEQGPLAPLTGQYALVEENMTMTITARGEELIMQGPDGGTYVAQAEADNVFVISAPGIRARLTFEMEDGNALRVLGEQYDGGGGDLYGRMLAEELKPFIDRTYRTLPEPEHTGLGGTSLGGLITLYLGLHYPHVFGKLIVASASAFWDDEFIVNEVRNAKAPGGQLLWLDVGEREDPVAQASIRNLRDALIEKSWHLDDNLHYLEAEGDNHHVEAWARRMDLWLRYLFPVRQQGDK